MSIIWITRVWAAPEPAVSGERLLLVALADMANEEGICWPSVPTLARRCAIAERTARRYLRRLEAGGFVESEMRSGRSTVYRLLQRNAATPDTVSPPDTADRGPEDAATPVGADRPPRTEVSADTLSEPSSNRAAALDSPEGEKRHSEELTGLLVKRGVHEPVAVRLVHRHDDAHIRRHLTHYDSLCSSPGTRRGPGWLVASIQEDYAIPEADPQPHRLYTYQEVLGWIERRGVVLSPSNPLTRWFEPVKQPGGRALFRRIEEPKIPGRTLTVKSLSEK